MQPIPRKSSNFISNVIASIQSILGIILLSIAGIFLLMILITAVTVHFDMVGMMILFALFLLPLVSGIVLLCCSAKRNKMIKLYNQYSRVLRYDANMSLDNLSRLTNTPQDMVFQNVKQLLSSNYLVNMHLDPDESRLVYDWKEAANARATFSQSSSGISFSQTFVYTPPQAPPPPAGVNPGPPSYKMVTCKNCGAPSKIIAGTIGECEYCHSLLE